MRCIFGRSGRRMLSCEDLSPYFTTAVYEIIYLSANFNLKGFASIIGSVYRSCYPFTLVGKVTNYLVT